MPTTTVTFQDTFTDTNGTLLTAHTPDTDTGGSGWSLLRNAEPSIQGNELAFSQTDTVISLQAEAGGTLDTVVDSGTGVSTSGPTFRMSDADNFLCLLCRGSNGEVTLRQRIAGSFTILVIYNIPGYVAGSPITLSAKYEGTAINVTINGVVDAITFTTTQFQTNTLAGYRSDTAATLDSIGFTPLVDYSVVDKVVLVIGQSNAEGRFANNQSYSHASLYASVFEGTAWADLIDTGANGEVWPLVAQRWLDDRNETVGFIYAAVGGTGLVNTTEWAAGGSAYVAMQALVTASGVTNIDAILWFQGERDAANSVTQSAYKAAINDLITRLHADLPGTPPLLCGQINNNGGTTDDIRNAQAESWGNANIKPGSVTYDIGPLADNLHFTTDAEAVVFADRWWVAIDEALFDGTVGTPPRLLSATIDGMIVSLTYDRDLEAATSYTADAWAFNDNGTTIIVTEAAKTGSRTVALTLASAPTSSAGYVTLGSGDSAQGDNVPRGLGEQPALPELALVPFDPAGDVVIAPREVLQVEKRQRVFSIS
ncbi:MAG: hypothetical protein GXP24_02845 [Planctomycetes bacterium]|nr:hypothetical protein [Planctomycetota bacterium]